MELTAIPYTIKLDIACDGCCRGSLVRLPDGVEASFNHTEGLLVLLEGIVRYGHGESVEGPADDPDLDQAETESIVHIEHGEYGYCPNFILVRTQFPDARPLVKAIAERGVLIRGYGDPLLQPYFRVTVGHPEENDLFLRALRESIEEMPA